MCQGDEGNRCFLNSKSIGAGVGGEGKEGQNDLHSGSACGGGMDGSALRGWVRGACGKQPLGSGPELHSVPWAAGLEESRSRADFLSDPQRSPWGLRAACTLRRSSHESCKLTLSSSPRETPCPAMYAPHDVCVNIHVLMCVNIHILMCVYVFIYRRVS